MKCQGNPRIRLEKCGHSVACVDDDYAGYQMRQYIILEISGQAGRCLIGPPSILADKEAEMETLFLSSSRFVLTVCPHGLSLNRVTDSN